MYRKPAHWYTHTASLTSIEGCVCELILMKPHEREKGGAERLSIQSHGSSENLERQMGGKIKPENTTQLNIKYSHKKYCHLLYFYHGQSCNLRLLLLSINMLIYFFNESIKIVVCLQKLNTRNYKLSRRCQKKPVTKPR